MPKSLHHIVVIECLRQLLSDGEHQRTESECQGRHETAFEMLHRRLVPDELIAYFIYGIFLVPVSPGERSSTLLPVQLR